MSRTTLCLFTASALAVISIGMMTARYCALGEEIKVPHGPGTWKVTLLIHGKSTAADARLITAVPLDFGRQHVFKEVCRSDEFYARPPDAKHPGRQQILWSLRGSAPEGPFRAHYQCYCKVNVHSPTAGMAKLARHMNADPASGELLSSEPRIESDHSEISALAREQTVEVSTKRDMFDALYHYVSREIGNEPNLHDQDWTALECLHNGSGDAGAKSRLLVALCRNRGIPARLVSGLALRSGHEQRTHVWTEAWIDDHWVPACTCYHHVGHVPATFLIFSYGDTPIVRGRNVRDLDHAFLVEKLATDDEPALVTSVWPRFWKRLSVYALPPAEQRLVEFLLLLPVAALIVCLFRNVIGIGSFGTFAPALLGLAFRDLASLPGILVFVFIVLLGWGLRRTLDRYHLLQVPRSAFLLSLVVFVLIALTMLANYRDIAVTKYISLFPIVILTGMIERFWTLEVEDGTASSFKTLLGTLLIATTISLLLGLHAVVHHLLRYPETLGLVMAAQLLLGRYTGYRLSELLRFRDFVKPRLTLTTPS